MKMQDCKYKELYDILKKYQKVAGDCPGSTMDYCFECAVRDMHNAYIKLNITYAIERYFRRKLYKAQYECCKRFNWVASPDAVKSELK